MLARKPLERKACTEGCPFGLRLFASPRRGINPHGPGRCWQCDRAGERPVLRGVVNQMEQLLLQDERIRAFLARYEQQSWPEVIRLLVLMGLGAGQQQQSGSSAHQQQQLSAPATMELLAQRNELQRQILRLQAMLDSAFDQLAQRVRACGPKRGSCGRVQQLTTTSAAACAAAHACSRQLQAALTSCAAKRHSQARWPAAGGSARVCWASPASQRPNRQTSGGAASRLDSRQRWQRTRCAGHKVRSGGGALHGEAWRTVAWAAADALPLSGPAVLLQTTRAPPPPSTPTGGANTTTTRRRRQ